jgi:hypothetical protein
MRVWGLSTSLISSCRTKVLQHSWEAGYTKRVGRSPWAHPDRCGLLWPKYLILFTYSLAKTQGRAYI